MSAPSITRTSAAELYDAHVMKNYARAPLTLVRGSGTQVWDDQGKSYLDFTSGIAVSALGHCHPHWVASVQRQAAELIHVSNLFRNPNQAELARRIIAQGGPGRVFFCNSGAEANEAMLKLARLHGKKKAGGVEGQCYKIIGAKHAFHGRTFGAMSATPQEKIQKGFAPLVPGFVFGELNNLKSFEDLIDESTCAIIVEPVQGESGINPCTPEFLVGLRELCNRHNLLLLLDEVQTGVGRTGSFFAFQQYGIQPDAASMAKGLGGGMPIGGVWVRENAAEYFQPGSHGTTFGGTPIACAAALAVLDVLEKEKLIERAAKVGGAYIEQLRGLIKEFPGKVVAVRGMGFLIGVQLASDPSPFIAALREEGLLVPASGNNVFRLVPPLNVTDAELAQALAIIRKVLAKTA